MTIEAHAAMIDRLREDYRDSVFSSQTFSINTRIDFRSRGFVGSHNVLFLSSDDVMTHEAPACIAAPLVTLVAKDAMSLGGAGQGSQPVPVRLYVPCQLSITARRLSIGDLQILVEPRHAVIACEQLTLFKSTEEDPSHFEVVKSWVLSDRTEIETVRRS